jgi:transcriptional regulator with GAF, ATPase, and Fis domain
MAEALAERAEPSHVSTPLRSLAAIQREAIEQVLAHTGGRVSGPRGAAAILGLKPTTLHSRMKKLAVKRGPRD